MWPAGQFQGPAQRARGLLETARDHYLRAFSPPIAPEARAAFRARALADPAFMEQARQRYGARTVDQYLGGWDEVRGG
jgi:hypothetical protein